METEREKLYAEAIEALDTDDELFCEAVNELNWYNGFADGYACIPMSELDEYYSNVPATKLIQDLTEDFNILDDYFYFSIYGLESTDDIVSLYRDNTSSEEVLDEILNVYPHVTFRYYDDMFNTLIGDIINAEDEESEEE